MENKDKEIELADQKPKPNLRTPKEEMTTKSKILWAVLFVGTAIVAVVVIALLLTYT